VIPNENPTLKETRIKWPGSIDHVDMILQKVAVRQGQISARLQERGGDRDAGNTPSPPVKD
jgi:hypothetical protein